MADLADGDGDAVEKTERRAEHAQDVERGQRPRNDGDSPRPCRITHQQTRPGG